jgi:serine protease Do
VYQSLRRTGRVDHVDIGVLPQTVTPSIAAGLGLAQDWGVVVADLLAHGPADAAGIRMGDVLVTVDGYAMQGVTELNAVLYQHPPDRPLKIELLRDGQKLAFEVPAFLVRGTFDQFVDTPDPSDAHIDRLDILALDLGEALRTVMPDVRTPAGAVVVGRARGFDTVETGLQPGDVISSINRTPIRSVAELRTAVGQLKRGEAVVLRIERLGRFRYVAFEME